MALMSPTIFFSSHVQPPHAASRLHNARWMVANDDSRYS